MIEADRVLRPLREAGPAIERLETYESPAVLLEALRATWHAVERSLRLLLRADPSAADELRQAAFSAELTTDAVVTELRRRDRISLELAGRIHELGRAVRRGEAGEVRAADADAAEAVVRGLRREVGELADVPLREAARSVVTREPLREAVHEVKPSPPVVKRWVVIAGIAGAALLGVVLAVLLLGQPSPMERGISAFRAENWALAEQRFREVLSRDDENVTARLYLARILRMQSRNDEAASLLSGAARLAPRDAAVRRELGYLFLDLNRPAQAVDQLLVAVEEEPDEPLNWVALVGAMQQAGNPAAEEWLRRAPASAQAMIRTGR